jgi:hypothetical protein
MAASGLTAYLAEDETGPAGTASMMLTPHVTCTSAMPATVRTIATPLQASRQKPKASACTWTFSHASLNDTQRPVTAPWQDPHPGRHARRAVSAALDDLSMADKREHRLSHLPNSGRCILVYLCADLYVANDSDGRQFSLLFV